MGSVSYREREDHKSSRSFFLVPILLKTSILSNIGTKNEMGKSMHLMHQSPDFVPSFSF
jgi:hypothetical protein